MEEVEVEDVMDAEYRKGSKNFGPQQCLRRYTYSYTNM